MGALLLQETFFDQGVNKPGGSGRVFPHGFNQIGSREGRGPQEGLEDQSPDLAVGIGKRACRWWWALLRLGLGAARLSMDP
jgi:hypothetical protein